MLLPGCVVCVLLVVFNMKLQHFSAALSDTVLKGCLLRDAGVLALEHR